jgi:hypothetical protein
MAPVWGIPVRHGRVHPGPTVTGNPYKNASGVIKLGTIAVSGKSGFTVKNAKCTFVNSKLGLKDITTPAVTGKFKTGKIATGKITFTQKLTGPGGFSKSCGPARLTFTATTK